MRRVSKIYGKAKACLLRFVEIGRIQEPIKGQRPGGPGDGQNRYGRCAEQGLRRGSNQETAEKAAAVGAHHDNIHVLSLDYRSDALPDISGRDDDSQVKIILVFRS